MAAHLAGYPLKRLLAAGVGDCYELGRVFRNGEAGTPQPGSPCLEWYRVGWDHHRLVQETAELVGQALALVGRHATLHVLSYRELFQQYVGVDPFEADEPRCVPRWARCTLTRSG